MTTMQSLYAAIEREDLTLEQAWELLIRTKETFIMQEKWQIESAWENGLSNCGEFNKPSVLNGGEYYQKTFVNAV